LHSIVAFKYTSSADIKIHHILKCYNLKIINKDGEGACQHIYAAEGYDCQKCSAQEKNGQENPGRKLFST